MENHPSRKNKRNCVRILNLLDRLADFPSDDEDNFEIGENPKISQISTSNQKSSQIVDKAKMLERIPPPIRLHDHSNPLDSFTDSEFADRYIFEKPTTVYILGLIEYGLLKPTNRGHPVAPLMQLLVTLRFLATGK